MTQLTEEQMIARVTSGAILVFLCLLTAFCSFNTVSAGHKGVKVTLGSVSPNVLPEGLYFKKPIIDSIVEMDARNQVMQVDTFAYTKDIQQAKFEATLNYRLDGSKAAVIYQNVGEDWSNALVPQVVQDTLKATIGKWDAVVLIENRDKATTAVLESLQGALSEKGVIVTNFSITNIDFNDEFEKAVEDKVTAIQRAAGEENKTKQIQEQAKQRVISAKAEAESMEIRSQALSQNKGLVEYEAVQKWNGELPTYMLGNSTPFINLSK